MIMTATRIWILLAVNCLYVTSIWAQNAREVSVCGPRCVKWILEHYGHDADLIELISEMQDGVVEQASSVEDIQAALAKRGVHSKSMKTGILSFPRWPYPAILHYRCGHFLVVEELKGGCARIRDGVAMDSSWKWIPSVMLGQSGVVVLTSDAPVDADLPLVRWPQFAVAASCIGIGGLGLFARRRSLSKLLTGVSQKLRWR
jgi:hypothetical protein